MGEHEKIKASHLGRHVYVYIRQSTASQVLCNRESTERQYKLVDRALELGWQRGQIKVIDEDLACSGSESNNRPGFKKLISEVALGLVGLVLSIEVSRVARNNTDWYRLLDLCGVTDTLIGDEEGLYHAGLFNDRLLLGLKGTMAEAELHVLRSRLNGGIRNKAARGELRRGLPVGFVWGEDDGEVLFHPSQDVVAAIRTVFERFAVLGTARQVWLYFRDANHPFPHQQPYRKGVLAEINWVTASYTAISNILRNPVYAGVYAYGKTRQRTFVDETGRLKKRIIRLPQSQWAVFIRNHHPGYIDWQTFQRNQKRLAQNIRPQRHQASGAVREGCALLQGLARPSPKSIRG